MPDFIPVTENTRKTCNTRNTRNVRNTRGTFARANVETALSGVVGS